MKLLNRTQHQRGVGLIEVLIALVVIAVGVIAVLGLQGTLMSGSAATKARNEAMILAREKTEELRNTIERDQFDTDLEDQDFTDDPDGTIEGVNAQYTRRWKLVDIDSVKGAGVKDTKELIMQVAWTDAQGSDNQVEFNTLVTYGRPMVSVLSAAADGHVSPGGADTGYEGLHRDTPEDEHISSTYTPGVGGLEDRLGIKKILRYSNSGHVQVRIADPECPSVDYTGDEYECICPLVDRVAGPDGAVHCVVFTAFGGTLLRFGGTVFVENYLANRNATTFDAAVLVKATSPAYCAHKEKGAGAGCDEIPSQARMNCVEYLCYASGDCSIRDGNDDAAGTGGGGDCPTGTDDELEALNLPDLNGGWYGKIGHYFPLENSANFPTVCMGKYGTVDDSNNPILDDDGNPVLADNLGGARSYYSLRTVSSMDWREGINQSFLGHNTLIVDTTANTNAVCETDGYEKMITAGIVWNSFIGPKVIRDVTGVDNTVLGKDESYDDIVAIYGEIEFPDHPPLGANEELVGNKSSGTFELLETGSTGAYAGFVDGECDFHEEGHSDIIYACNYVNTRWTSGWSWSGYVTARGTMSYEVVNTITHVITSYDDRICTVTNYYDSQSPGRYSDEDIPTENPASVISCETN